MSRSACLATAVLLPLAAFAAAFAGGRATAGHRASPDAIRLRDRLPAGILHTPAGALAAADNYAAAGITASLDPHLLARFAEALVSGSTRSGFLSASARINQMSAPPAGSRAIGIVVAHALRAYSGRMAQVTTWQLASYWGQKLAPTQYSALADLTLRWSWGRWEIVAVDERVPGPVPARVGARRGATAPGLWDRGLAGMGAPFYGAG